MAVAGCGQRLSLQNQDFLEAGSGVSLNGHIQDPGIRISFWDAAAWENFTPSNGAVGFSLVNGADRSRFLYNGKNLDIFYCFLFSTLSTYTGGEIQLPLPGGTTPPQMGGGIFADDVIFGTWDLYDASSGLYYSGSTWAAAQPTSVPFRFRTSGFSQGGTTAQTWRQGTPITLAAGDVFSACVRLELA